MDDLEQMNKLVPELPHWAGVAETIPGSDGIEGAHLLADEAREALRRSGFADEQIDAWAEAYVADEHSGDVDSFVDWIAEQERRHGDIPAA